MTDVETPSKLCTPILDVSTRPWRIAMLLIISDVLAFLGAGIFSIWVRSWFAGGLEITVYSSLWPALLFTVLAYAVAGLYPGVIMSPAEELRRLSQTTSLIYLALGAMTFIFRGDEAYSRSIFIMAWLFTLLAVPLGRAFVRFIFAKRKWWGYPVVVLGAAKTGGMVVWTLKRHPELGLKPVAFLDDDPKKKGKIHGIPIVGDMRLATVLTEEFNIKYAIFAMPGIPRSQLLQMIEHYAQIFPHLFIIPELFKASNLWVTVKDLGGLLGLEVRQRLLVPWSQKIKRVVDIIGAIVGMILFAPIGMVIALLIKITSPGPVFFGQERLGKNQTRFKALKFRSMYLDAEERLQEILQKHPDLRKEYEVFHKLRNDPRVTPMGYFLRKYSLDEFPQLWNVLRGEMSLVGPRAYLPHEMPLMHGTEKIILRILPGITGFWQVTARNQVSFQGRLDMDIYYVRNWSLWFDLYLLGCTVWVVLFERAY